MSAREPAHLLERAPGPWLAIVLLPFVTLVVPASLILQGPLLSNGWPARLIVFWIAAATVLGWIARRPPRDESLTPVELGAWVLLGALVVSYAAGWLRVLTPEESAGALRAALVLVPLALLTLGIARNGDRGRVDLLLISMILGLAVSALVAWAQQLQPFTFAELLRVPGFVAREEGGFGSRGDFTRVRGAAAHAIEFGVLGGALLPICLHYARFARTHGLRVAAGWTTGVTAVAVLLTVSRSAVLAVVVAMLVYAAVLTRRMQANLAVLALLGAVMTRAVAPGLLGSIRSIFVNAPQDDSITGRTDDYEIVAQFFDESPIVGHGLGTFRPDVYFFLDNQYLMALIEGGLVLLLATVVFFALALAAARGARLRSSAEQDISLSQAITAALAAIAVSGLFFDLFSFGQVTIVTFVLAGTAAVLWRESLAGGVVLATPWMRIRGARRGQPVPVVLGPSAPPAP